MKKKAFLRSLLQRFIRMIFFFILFQFFFDYGLTWVSKFFLSFGLVDWIDFLLSLMERLPISVGGGGSDAGPSRRPVPDMNSFPPTSPEPEPAPPAESEPASSSELQEARKELRAWEQRLTGWYEEERGVEARRLEGLRIHREVQRSSWKSFFAEIRRQGLIGAIFNLDREQP